MSKGIIYLIQPCELVGTNRYKIGCSKDTSLNRVQNGYKKGTRYLYIGECNEPLILERKIINEFNQKFKLIAGKEYFEGKEEEILNSFLNIVLKKYSLVQNNQLKAKIKYLEKQLGNDDDQWITQYSKFLYYKENEDIKDRKQTMYNIASYLQRLNLHEAITDCCSSDYCNEYGDF